MSYVVRLTSDLYKVEPGNTVPVTIEITNKSESAERYELEVEGMESTWVAVPVPTFVVEPNEVYTERIFLKPPREAESLAGTYPFVVNVRNIETGETRRAQGALEVGAYFNLSLDIQPKKGTISPLSKSITFQLTLMNLSNSEQTMQLFAADNDAVLAFEFDSDQVVLGAGQQRILNLVVTSSKGSLLANSRLQNFSVSARGVENPALGTSTTGQIEQKALASPGVFSIALFLIAIIAAWIALWPKPPHIDSIVIDPGQATIGQPVTLKWKSTRASNVRIQIGNWIQERQLPEGTVTYVPEKAGQFAVEVTAFMGDQSVRDVSQVLLVNEPPTVPDPVIREISVDDKQIKIGQPFILHYKFNESVTKATLFPMQRDLDIHATEIQLQADVVGKSKYFIKAYNSAGKSVESSVSVNVVKVSKSKIVEFMVKPLQLDEAGGMVGIDFSVTGAVKIELVFGGTKEDLTALGQIDNTGALKGHKDIQITQDTTFKLVAYDDEGVALASSIETVKVKKAVQPDASPDSGTTGGLR